MTEVYKYDNIDLSKLEFSVPEKQGNIYYCNISYKDKPFFLQTSRMGILSDINNLNEKIPSIEFKILDNNLELYDLLMRIDELLIKATYNNSEKWFNQKIPLENIDDMYKRICKPLKKNNNPSFRIKLPIEDGNVLSKIYNQDRDIINIKDIKNNSDAICIVHIRGIKFMKQQYICDMYINQMKIFIPFKNDYQILEECLIEETLITDYDRDIIDEEELINLKKNKEKILEKRKIELGKIKLLEEEILKMNDKLKNIE